LAQGGAPLAQKPAAPEGRAAPRERPRLPGGNPLLPSNGLPLAVPAEGARRERHDLLAAPARLARGGGLDGAPPRAPRRAWEGGPGGLVEGVGRLGEPGREKGGEDTGPSPVDRGKPGTKRHLIVDARGLPLAVLLSGANRHDSLFLLPLLDAAPAVATRRGPRRRRPAKLHADKAYDHRRLRKAVQARGIACRIARKGVEPSERLGRRRWVVERTLSWLSRFRRLAVRYERRADIHLGLTVLACAVICWGKLKGFC
jgi:transposase